MSSVLTSIGLDKCTDSKYYRGEKRQEISLSEVKSRNSIFGKVASQLHGEPQNMGQILLCSESLIFWDLFT